MLPLVYHPIYSDLELPPEHRYPITKYRRLYQFLCEQLQIAQRQDIRLYEPEPITVAEIKQLHCPDYIDALFGNQLPAAKMRRIGFPWSQQLITRTQLSSGGTRLAIEKAMQHGLCIHLSGGYHHAHSDFGSGFCLINDLALAARHALTLEGIDRVMIVDCDVHHGDGTATLLADDPQIITFSVHGEKNFPARKPSSTLDLALPSHTNSDDYLTAFGSLLKLAIAQYQPDLVIYDAGVDIHRDDELGYLDVCQAGIYQRDLLVLGQCFNESIPVAAVIGGGYRHDHQQLVSLHAQLVYAAMNVLGIPVTPTL